jgi:hypothetical protein
MQGVDLESNLICAKASLQMIPWIQMRIVTAPKNWSLTHLELLAEEAKASSFAGMNSFGMSCFWLLKEFGPE